jgi:uncharacterized protein (TIGR02687 family)
MSKIKPALEKLFDRHRIVFWYDANRELRSDFERLALPSVEKVEIRNNEFGLKHRMLRGEPETRFLVYHEGPEPQEMENWLLDLQLAHGMFRTDQAALWLSELELGMEFAELVQAHGEFFQAARRKEQLKKLIKPGDSQGRVRMHMLAVCAGSDSRLDSVLEHLLQELSEQRDDKWKLVDRCGLSGFLWEQMQRAYGYQSASPGLKDFVIELFKSCYAMSTDGEVRLTGDALVFLKRWKDSRSFEGSFETLSGECAEVLNIKGDLEKRDFRVLLEVDLFRLVDQKILHEMVKEVLARTAGGGEVSLWVRQRRQGHWFGVFEHVYAAVEAAALFMGALSEQSLKMESLSDGVRRYCASWFRVDQLYRKFIRHTRASRAHSLLAPLQEQVENLYSNQFLLKVNDAWQQHVDGASVWEVPGVLSQRKFYGHYVQPFPDRDNKVCVIVSDAMRYEIAEELLREIRREDRYSADLEAMVSVLPSYTQLGMAALLPHQELALSDGDTGMVLVDGQSSQGLANRQKILDKTLQGRGCCVKAEEITNMRREECRDLVKRHDVIYVYHNRIDAVGDKMESESRTVDAVEETLEELVALLKKLNNANLYNFFLTADHGFVYQHRELDESDFSGSEAAGDQVLYRDRRFVLGHGLKESPGLKQFNSADLGLAGGMDVQISKSINRMRLKGSGSRFVHGGAALQEVVVPVLKINKKRTSDLSRVDVEIIRGSSSVITSGQIAVTLYQNQAVTEKVQPRVLRAGIYTQAGELISDSHELVFDFTSENPRNRELHVRFLMTRGAEEANGQEVHLRLEENHENTSHYRTYKSLTYTLRRSFTSDFDF